MAPNTASEHSKQVPPSSPSKSNKSPPPPPPPTKRSKKEKRSLGKDSPEYPEDKSLGSKYHFNTIWSLWYCFLTTAFISFLVYKGIRRFLMYASLPWPDDKEPYMELNAQVGLVGAAIVVMPFFVVSSLLKVGNMANDGFKLGSSLSTCSRDPPSVLQPTTGLIRNLWMHGVPTSPFLHLIAAFCLLLPQTLMGGALIKSGFLPLDEIWRSDLSAISVPMGGPSASEIIEKSPNNSTFILKPASSAFTIETLTTVVVPPLSNLGSIPRSSNVGGGGGGGGHSKISNFGRTKPFASRGKRSYGNTFHGALDKPPNIPASFLIPPKSSASRKGKNKMSSFAKFPTGEESDFKGNVDVIETSSPPLSSSTGISSFLSLHLTDLAWNTFSPELINYAFALIIFAIRYPAVFWHTNKTFSFLFSLQMIFSGIVIVLNIDSFTILYKFQLNISKTSFGPSTSFLSNTVSSILLLLMSVLTLTVSSSALYFYGYQRFASFLERSSRRFHITYSAQPLVMRPHTSKLSAVAVLFCLLLSLGPLLWDFNALYKKSGGNQLIFVTIAVSIAYLGLWVGLWLFFSVKSSWVFKLRVSVARAFVSSARSIKLVNDVEMSTIDDIDDPQAPILVIGGGRAVAVKENGPKKAIMGVVTKFKEDKKQKGNEEEIYWLKPTLNLSFDRRKYGGKSQAKVTFKDLVEEKYSARKNLLKGQFLSETEDEDETGDYAILKESFSAYVSKNDPEMSHSDDSDLSQRSPIMEDTTRYVDRKQILAYQHEVNARTLSSDDSSPVLVVNEYDDHLGGGTFLQGHHTQHRHQVFLENQGSLTPRSNRSNDSGVPLETPSQRSDSISSNSSHLHTPPDNSDENGVHSSSIQDNLKNSWSYNEIKINQQQYGHGVPRSFSSGKQISSESTAAIRRQRNLTQEIRLPGEPIYGSSRKTSSSSFSPYEGNSLFHSPLSPLPPLPEVEVGGGGGGGESPLPSPPSYPPPVDDDEIQNCGNGSQDQNYHPPPTYPQMPLPPIPQGMMPPPPMEPLRNAHSGIYGRASSSVYHPQSSAEGIYYYGHPRFDARSASLRYPSNRSRPDHQVQFTNTFPHVLRRDPHYDTNV